MADPSGETDLVGAIDQGTSSSRFLVGTEGARHATGADVQGGCSIQPVAGTAVRTATGACREGRAKEEGCEGGRV